MVLSVINYKKKTDEINLVHWTLISICLYGHILAIIHYYNLEVNNEFLNVTLGFMYNAFHPINFIKKSDIKNVIYENNYDASLIVVHFFKELLKKHKK